MGMQSFPEVSTNKKEVAVCVYRFPVTRTMSVWLGRMCVSLRAVCVQHAGYGGGIPRIRAPHALSPGWHAVRQLSVSPGFVIKYEELKDMLKNDGAVLIDVREPWEIKEYGIIKGSINIPLGDLQAALKLNPKEFEAKYQTKLPGKSNTIVFSCLAGIRSGKALEVANSLGYNRVHHYSGGFEDWSRHEVPEKPQ